MERKITGGLGLKTFEEKRKILYEYILLKIEENDYHAVSDAANDLRVLEAANGVECEIFVEAGIKVSRETVGGKVMTCFKADR